MKYSHKFITKILSLALVGSVFLSPIQAEARKQRNHKEKGLINFDGNTISLTENGFLLSNNIITELMYN